MISSHSALTPGMRFRYLGDDRPYRSRFLKKKGAEKGHYLLPEFFDREDGGRDWFDSRGDIHRDYEVVTVERGRFDKNGKALPPLIVLQRSDMKGSGWKIGLRMEDFNCKFRQVGDGLDEEVDDPEPPEPINAAAAIAANPLWGSF